MSQRRKSAFTSCSRRKRTKSLFAFPRFLLMSSPECPPVSPFTVTSIALYPAGTDTRSRLYLASVRTPPAQLTKISPSSSESRLISKSPDIKSDFISKAPVRPVSSSRVNTHSIGPCSISVAWRRAISIAIPIPSSAPRVVPFAFNHSPSM